MGGGRNEIAANEADFALFVLDFELDEAIFLHQGKQSFDFPLFHLVFQATQVRG